MKILLLLILAFIFYSCTSVDSLIKDKKLDDALVFCQKENEHKENCYEKIADTYFKKGDFLNAEKYYDIDFANNEIKREKASFQIAELFFYKKDYTNALKYYDKTNRKEEGYLKVADSYLKDKNLSKALVLYEMLDNNDGIKNVADKYYQSGEYLRALSLYKRLKLQFKYSFKIASKLLEEHNYIEAGNLFLKLGNIQKSKKSYKDFAYFLLKKDDFTKILNDNSPIVSIMITDDYLFAINQKGDIYQTYLYNNNFKKVFSINSKKERVISAKYTYKSNQIIMLTNAGLVFYDIVGKKIIRRLNKKVTAFAITKDEDFIITANGKIISVRDFDSLDDLVFFKAHTARVNKILVDKNKVISAGEDKLIRVWDIETGKQLYILRGHFLSITSISLSKTGRFLASGSKDRTVKVWDLDKRIIINDFKFKTKINSVVFSHDSSKIIVGVNNRIYKIIDLIDNKISDSLLFHSSIINTINIEQNDDFIYSGDKSGKLFISMLNKDIIIENMFSKASLTKSDYFDIAELYFNNKKYELASKYYNLSYKREEGLLKIADNYYKLGNYEEALKYYKLLDSEKFALKIADTYFKLGDYNNSGEFYLKIKKYVGVLKSAKMFLYEDNYYDAIRLYVMLSKSYDKDTENDKISAIYLKIADIFMTIKENTYRGSDNKDYVKEVNEKLKKWYKKRFDIAQEYYDKANKSQEGYLKLGDYLCKNNKFDLGISYYKYLDDIKKSRKLIRICQKNAGIYFFEKAGESYKKLSQLSSSDGDWDLIKESYNNSVDFIESSKKYYKLLKSYRKLRKIQKIKRALKRYKKKLGI